MAPPEQLTAEQIINEAEWREDQGQDQESKTQARTTKQLHADKDTDAKTQTTCRATLGTLRSTMMMHTHIIGLLLNTS